MGNVPTSYTKYFGLWLVISILLRSLDSVCPATYFLNLFYTVDSGGRGGGVRTTDMGQHKGCHYYWAITCTPSSYLLDCLEFVIFIVLLLCWCLRVWLSHWTQTSGFFFSFVERPSKIFWTIFSSIYDYLHREIDQCRSCLYLFMDGIFDISYFWARFD